MNKICYLLSGYKSNEGFVGKIASDLKKEIINNDKLIYIAADFSNYEKNDTRFENTKLWFNNIGINFKKNILIDNRVDKEKAKNT